MLVTGGTGMIGSHLVEILVEQGADVRIVEHKNKASGIFSPDCLRRIEVVRGDLTKAEDCGSVTKGIDCVFQLSAVLTGVLGNIERPVQMFTPNVLIQTNMIEAAYKNDVERYLFTSSACIYSSDIPLPFKEEDGMKGVPDKNNEAYGWAKRMGELQAQYYQKEYGMKIGIVRPFNTYGPRDNFHPRTSHAIAALIRKAEERQNPFRIWGDGQSIRDFVFVTDTARGMMAVLEKYPKADPVNVATGRKISILDLTNLILKICGHKAHMVFEKDKPSGQKSRYGSIEKAERLLGFKTQVSLEQGLERTVKWFRESRTMLKEYV